MFYHYFYFFITFFKKEYIMYMARKKLEEEDKKTRITISIDNKIFENLNEYINDNDINRSKLIEKLLKDYKK